MASAVDKYYVKQGIALDEMPVQKVDIVWRRDELSSIVDKYYVKQGIALV